MAIISLGNQELSRNVYNDTAGDRYGTLERMEYGNGHVVRNSYDEFKRIVGVQYDDDETDRYSYEYGANGQVARVTNHELNRTVLSEHDSCSRPMRVTHMEGDAHVYTGEVTYDVHNNLASFEEQVGTARTPYTTTFSYDEENRPTLLKYGSDTDKVTYTYDGLGRIEKRTLTVGGTARETSYAYIAGGHGDGSTTGLIATIEQTGGNFTYTYDDNGNITSVVQDGVTTSYTYDALGKLIRVVDGQEGATWEYSYDQGGNILSKKKYVDDTLVESKTFTYGNANWRDQLTAVNGVGITYDNIGNPLNDGTWTYTWEKGRQLKSMSKSGTTASFKYNENGLRIQKTVNGVVTNYTLHGKNIVHMTQGSNNLHFFYDASNKPAIVEYIGTKYAYVHNLQGDIVAILDSNGNKVVEYKYDAWGKPISKTGNMKDGLGTLNPFRYRGYVYDEETAKYYVSNRYYCPENSRWLNSDSRFGDVGKELYGNDMFVYCWNNPICMEDPSGNWPRWITAAVAVVAAVVAVVAAPATATTAATVSVIATGVYVIQSAHYDDREARNSDLPRSPQEAIDLGWYGPNTDPQGPSAACHQFTSPDKSNIKYVSPDGHREVIFDSNGNMVVDPKDVGTYNYCPSGTFWGDIGHGGLDILPWIVFGNSDEDPGPAVNIIVDCFD